MKINECAVIDKEALQLTIKILELSKLSDMQTKIDTNNVNIVIKTLEEIIKNSKPLAPIIEDAYTDGMSTDGDWEYCSNKYVEETEV